MTTMQSDIKKLIFDTMDGFGEDMKELLQRDVYVWNFFEAHIDFLLSKLDPSKVTPDVYEMLALSITTEACKGLKKALDRFQTNSS